MFDLTVRSSLGYVGMLRALLTTAGRVEPLNNCTEPLSDVHDVASGSRMGDQAA